MFMNDLHQGAQGLIDFPWVLKDCGHVRIKRYDAHAPLVTRCVGVGPGVAKVVLGQNIVQASPDWITGFTKVLLHSF